MAYHGDNVIEMWINFNGETTSVRDSYNLQSLTDNGGGSFTISIGTDMSNTNYCVLNGHDNRNHSRGHALFVTDRSVGSVSVVGNSMYSNSGSDSAHSYLAIVGDKS